MPHFKHDCMNPHCCRYVGSTPGNTNVRPLDVYVYMSHGTPSLLVRAGDDGPEYCTMPLDFARKFAETQPETSQNYVFGVAIYDAFTNHVTSGGKK